MSFDAAQKVADAVLYEGYALYPYRPSSQKNRIRFQWGVLMPPAFAALDPSERSFSQTQCLVERAESVTIRLRFLSLHPGQSDTWDEAREEQFEFEAALDRATEERLDLANLSASVRVEWQSVEGPVALRKLTVQIENETEVDTCNRDEALRHALVSCHLLLGAEGSRASFLSLMDPPEWARHLASNCENVGTFPVLVGESDRSMLSSPIILYDHPVTAPESPTNLFDSTEIDEILTLRTMTLTEEEKQEARATDPRIAALIDQVDHLPPEMLERLHGAIRSVDPPTDTVFVAGQPLSRGSKVRLRPTLRGADAQDMFLVGKEANVEAVLNDVDGNQHLAVSLVDDPGADLLSMYGRHLYFSPDEVEPT